MTTPPTPRNARTTTSDEAALALAGGLSREYLLHHRVCPIALRDPDAVVVAVTEDAVPSALDDISVAYDRVVVTEAVPPTELERLIERIANRTDHAVEVTRIEISDDDLAADVRDLANQPSATGKASSKVVYQGASTVLTCPPTK